MIYRVKYVAFIDLLGFSRLVAASSQDAARQLTIKEAVDRLRNTACCDPEIDLLVSYFSDCLVLSSARSPSGLAGILQSVRMIAENLLVVDMPVRGGLTVGGIYHDSEFMFGPGMLEAYGMERDETRHPTILVSKEVETDCREVGLSTLLIHDDVEPDRHYVHYLISFSRYDPTPRNGLLVLDGPARLIRHFIAKRLSAGEGSILQKAEWLERYWNETVGVCGHLGCVDRVADLVPTDARPFRSRLALVAHPL